MKRIRTIVIDDQQVDLDVQLLLIKKVPRLHLCGVYTDPMKGLEATKSKKIDLVFLDVQMEPINGLELMLQFDPAIKVVLCTSYIKFASEGFRLKAIDFVPKPVRYERFLQAVEMVEISLSLTPSVISRTPDHHFFFVKVNGKGYRQMIEFREINYIEAKNNRVMLHLEGQDSVEIISTLSKLIELLPASLFIRIHNSHIVSKSRLRSVHHGHVVLKKPKDHILSIGPSFKYSLTQWVEDRLLK